MFVSLFSVLMAVVCTSLDVVLIVLSFRTIFTQALAIFDGELLVTKRFF